MKSRAAGQAGREARAAVKPLSRNDLLLMGLLIGRPMHGYELSETLSRPGLGEWAKLGRTSVYYALGRLERDGLITKHVERHADKPERSVYSMTDLGREAFFGTLEQTLRSPEDAMTEFDVALFYSNRLHRGVAQDALEERVAQLQRTLAEVDASISGAEKAADPALRLVLGRRRAILQANLTFLKDYVDLLSTEQFGHEIGLLAGSLADTMLHEVLKTLASSGRSGVLRVSANGVGLELAMRRGRIEGMALAPGLEEQAVLRHCFTSRTGEYEFVPADEVPDGFTRVDDELDLVILKGCRGVAASTAFEHLLPDPQTLLGMHEGLRSHSLRLDLTDDETALLAVLDGVKTVPELARRLGADEAHIVRTAFPLWAIGWVVRVGRDKRDLVLAIAAYAQRWADAVTLFAGTGAAARLAEATAEPQGGEQPLRFPLDGSDLAACDFPYARGAVAMAGCEFIERRLDAVEALLGEVFVTDVLGGFASQLPLAQAEVLVKASALPEPALRALETRLAGEGRRGTAR